MFYFLIAERPQNASVKQERKPNRKERRKHLQCVKNELPLLEDKVQFPGLGEPAPAVSKPVPTDYSNIWAKCKLEK